MHAWRNVQNLRALLCLVPMLCNAQSAKAEAFYNNIGQAGTNPYLTSTTAAPYQYHQQPIEPASLQNHIPLEFEQSIAQDEEATAKLSAMLRKVLENPNFTPVEVAHFYQSRDMLPFWLADNAEAAAQFVEVLSEIERYGLNGDRYALQALQTALATNDPNDVQAETILELTFTAAYLAIARDLSGGVVNPRNLNIAFDVRYEAIGVSLSRLYDGVNMRSTLADIGPKSVDYQRALDSLTHLREQAENGGYGPPLIHQGTLRLGSQGEAVQALRERLVQSGDMAVAQRAQKQQIHPFATDLFPQTVETNQNTDYFGTDLDIAVKHFQARHGLKADGLVGRQTYAALNVPIEERIAQLAVNLERMRWRDYVLKDRYLLVNQADYSLDIVDGARSIFHSRVIIGKPEKRLRTPEFSDEISYIVANPSWNVPFSIATREILPELKTNATYLFENNMELIDQTGSIVQPELVDWPSITAQNFPFRIRQRPGEGNALGRVKIMFPNGFNVYLHDTASRSLFDESRRAFSHGCVRVHKPLELAQTLLNLQSNLMPTAFTEALESGQERTLSLSTPLPVHLIYMTAWTDSEGILQFRNDVYSKDAFIKEALQENGIL